MAKHLAPATETPKKIFEGSYTLVGKNVHVEVSAAVFVLISQSTLSTSLCGHLTVLQLEANFIMPFQAYFYVTPSLLLFQQVVMHYAVVHFELMILDGQDGYIGKFNTLRLVEHASVAVFRGTSVPFH